ncbi:MAG: hypothetical protein GX621_18845 [Pirellulaceae bacterium]|nr:hypothetical protein [Pirellulaceae bacterium]
MSMTVDERAVQQPRGVTSQAAWFREVRCAIWEQAIAEREDPRATPDAVTPERERLADAGILHLSPIVRQLVELWKEPEEDEYGRLKPTPDAFDRAVRLMVDAAIEAHSGKRRIPPGRASTDSEGGVRIEWIRPGASVHLVVSAKDREEYLYHEVGNDYATVDATPEAIAYWLQRID